MNIVKFCFTKINLQEFKLIVMFRCKYIELDNV